MYRDIEFANYRGAELMGKYRETIALTLCTPFIITIWTICGIFGVWINMNIGSKTTSNSSKEDKR